jgi:hypothetical protein
MLLNLADELHDLDAITSQIDREAYSRAARYRDSSRPRSDGLEAELREQVSDRSTVGDEPLLSVDDHGHESFR